jgi:hypothetical protein
MVAASIAVLPAPMMATFLPTGIVSSCFGAFDKVDAVDHAGQVFAGNAEGRNFAESSADEDRVVARE